ncbi:MAG: hypothetical protein KF784_11095 [Fimbriimonadaceae bacterium]|nr:hypothetical protein [Fimbriimonadaceae bacterium]
MNSALHMILGEQEKYKTIWHRTYAPLRKALAGTWVVQDEHKGFELTIDLDGGFKLVCFEKNLALKGRYAVVPVNGAYYLTLDTQGGEIWALKLEEVDMWHLKLRWVDETGSLIELTRRASPTGAMPRPTHAVIAI